jgi:hypothetical protein
MEACHGPGGKLDNRLSNLEWGTPEKNNGADKRRDGTAYRGERHHRAKLTEDDVREIRRQGALGVPYSALATKYPVSPSMIGLICRRRAWAWVD